MMKFRKRQIRHLSFVKSRQMDTKLVDGCVCGWVDDKMGEKKKLTQWLLQTSWLNEI